MVGYYHLNMRSLTKDEVPENIKLEKGEILHQNVQVFHFMFIPIFPMAKKWVIEEDGFFKDLDRISLLRLEHQIAEKRYPWYAYLWIILIVLYIGYLLLSNWK